MQTIYAFSNVPGIATGSTGTMWRMAYQSTIQLYKGTVNSLRLVIFNDAQKAVDLSGYDLEVQIVDKEAKAHLVTMLATISDPVTGVAEVTFTADDLSGLDNQFYHLIARLVDIDDGSSYANAKILYLDDHYGVFLPIQIESAWDLAS